MSDQDRIINYTVRLPLSVKNTLRDDAAKSARSLNAHFVWILEKYAAGELVPVDDLLKDPRVVNFAKAAIKCAE